MFLGQISELHPKYGTPVFAMIGMWFWFSIFCLSTFISPSMEAAYWTLTINTLCYFIPYLMMFSAFFVLRKKFPDVKRTFTIPGKVLPKLLPTLGFFSILFAVLLLFVPPAEVDMGNIFIYELQIGGGGLFFALLGDWLYRRAKKRNKKSADGVA